MFCSNEQNWSWSYKICDSFLPSFCALFYWQITFFYIVSSCYYLGSFTDLVNKFYLGYLRLFLFYVFLNPITFLCSSENLSNTCKCQFSFFFLFCKHILLFSNLYVNFFWSTWKNYIEIKRRPVREFCTDYDNKLLIVFRTLLLHSVSLKSPGTLE